MSSILINHPFAIVAESAYATVSKAVQSGGSNPPDSTTEGLTSACVAVLKTVGRKRFEGSTPSPSSMGL